MRMADRLRGYEDCCKTTFLRRTPAIVRLDGRCFREKTRGLDKPIDKRIQRSMDIAAKAVCMDIPICVASLQFSDEVSFFLNDEKEVGTSFLYNVQNILSAVTSAFTIAFNEAIKKEFPDRNWHFTFEGKAFSIPYIDVVSYGIWRQSLCYTGVLRSLAASLGGTKYASGTIPEVKEFVEGLGIDFDNWPIGDIVGHWCVRENDRVIIRDDLKLLHNTESCEYLRGLFKSTIYWDIEKTGDELES